MAGHCRRVRTTRGHFRAHLRGRHHGDLRVVARDRDREILAATVEARQLAAERLPGLLLMPALGRRALLVGQEPARPVQRGTFPQRAVAAQAVVRSARNAQAQVPACASYPQHGQRRARARGRRAPRWRERDRQSDPSLRIGSAAAAECERAVVSSRPLPGLRRQAGRRLRSQVYASSSSRRRRTWTVRG